MAKKLKGRTGDVANSFLGSEFWRPGVSINGTVLRRFESANGQCYALEVNPAVELNGEPIHEVALGNLNGLRIAVQALMLKTSKSATRSCSSAPA
ncbi:MAG TPA: hypothetical protein VIM00_08500, partial [Candidatus Acidoferrum sp.]